MRALVRLRLLVLAPRFGAVTPRPSAVVALVHQPPSAPPNDTLELKRHLAVRTTYVCVVIFRHRAYTARPLSLLVLFPLLGILRRPFVGISCNLTGRCTSRPTQLLPSCASPCTDPLPIVTATVPRRTSFACAILIRHLTSFPIQACGSSSPSPSLAPSIYGWLPHNLIPRGSRDSRRHADTATSDLCRACSARPWPRIVKLCAPTV